MKVSPNYGSPVGGVMILDVWAARWQIPASALAELKQAMGVAEPPIKIPAGVSEAATQQRIRLEACKQGKRFWRNNNGATLDETGRMIRFGLANDSAALSKQIKSSDLIGITPHYITAADVGRPIGIFTSIECKRPGWKYRGTPREVAQLAWVNLVLSMGGIAKFATGPEEL